MINIILGNISLFLVIVLLYFLYKNHNNYKLSILIIFSIAFIFRIYSMSDIFLHEWDERYHALVSKNFFENPFAPYLYKDHLLYYNFKNWTSTNIWLEKPPLTYFFIGISLKLFGNNEIALRLPSLLFSLISIFITYLIAKELFNKKVAVFSIYFYAINGLLIDYVGGKLSSDHVDILLVLLVELTMYLSVLTFTRKKTFVNFILIGFFIGLGFLTKWFVAFLALPVWMITAFFSGKYTIKEVFFYSFVILFSVIITIIPWLSYNYLYHKEELIWVINKFLFAYNTVVENHTDSWYYYFYKIMLIYGLLIYIPVLFFIKVFYKKANWRYLFLLLWAFIPIFIFSFASTKRYGYITPSSASYFIIISFYTYFLFYKKRITNRKLLMSTLIILLIILPFSYNIERGKYFKSEITNPEWTKEIKNLKSKYSYSDKTVFFNINHAIEAMFYNDDIIVYKRIPSKKEIDNIYSKGYNIFINDSGQLPNYCYNNNKVKLINLKHNYTPDSLKQNKHLPEIPSAENVKEDHLKLGEMNNLLLKKIEELTLYIIDLQKQIDELKEK